MSANPARLLGFGETSHNQSQKRGRIAPGYRADIVIVDIDAPWEVKQEDFKTRGKNSPFEGRRLYGKILMTLHSGRVVYIN